MLPIASIAAVLLAAPVPGGAPGADVRKSSRLWATVNVCDTSRAPNTVGVRVSMPGSGKRRERMFARIQLEYFDDATKAWVSLGDGGNSGWLALGKATYLRRETGWSQPLSAPAPGQQYRIRGTVRFEWRVGAAAVRSARRVTVKRSGRVLGADPVGFSAAECVIAAP